MQYYNTVAGATAEEIAATTTDFDQFKNPKGSAFDLGRDNAFSNFRILVGNFFHRTREFDQQKFKYDNTTIQFVYSFVVRTQRKRWKRKGSMLHWLTQKNSLSKILITMTSPG